MTTQPFISFGSAYAPQSSASQASSGPTRQSTRTLRDKAAQRLLLLRWATKAMLRILVLLLGLLSLNATAGLFGFGDFSWKEEVLLHDGRKIIVKRSQSYGGRREPGQDPPIKEHVLTFQLPGSGKSVKWISEFSQDVGRANFDLFALHVLNDTPYVVAMPNLCVAYNKWGRPNPPYVFFRYDGTAWQRIALAELPQEFVAANVIVNVRREEDIERAAAKLGYVPADAVRSTNQMLQQAELRSILREAVKRGTEGSAVNCPDLSSSRYTSPKAPLPIFQPSATDVSDK